MKYIITTADNGYIIEEINKHEEDQKFNTLTVYETIDDVLRHIGHNEDPGSRYDEKRLYVIRAPGDKNEKFTAEHSKVIWPDFN